AACPGPGADAVAEPPAGLDRRVRLRPGQARRAGRARDRPAPAGAPGGALAATRPDARARAVGGAAGRARRGGDARRRVQPAGVALGLRGPRLRRAGVPPATAAGVARAGPAGPA